MRSVVSLLLVLVIVPLPLAYASPPDQTWIGGLYDQADYDDVVTLLTSTFEVSPSDPGVDLGPVASVGEVLRPMEHSRPAAAALPFYRLRAPPLA